MAGVKGAAHANMAMAMAIAGRASRACDVCGSQRARWYCEADNAHLCNRCDQSVHSANALALRHERVRLNPQDSTAQHMKKVVIDTLDASNKSHKPHHPRPADKHSLPSRKRSRLSRRPNPHLRPPTSTLKSQNRRGKVKSEVRGAEESHEVPNFITVNIQESPISFAHDSATAMSMAEFCKERATAAASVYVDVEDAYEEISSGDSGPDFLVPNGYMNDFESAIGASIGCHEDAGSPFDAGNGDMDMNKSHDIVFIGNDLELCGGDEQYDDYPLDFSDIVGLRDGDAFEGDCGDTSELVDEGGEANKDEDGDGDGDGDELKCSVEARAQSEVCEDHGLVSYTKDFSYKVKQEYTVPDSYDLIKKEVAAVLRCSLQGEEVKPAPSLLRLNYEDIMSAWSDRSLWTDGKRPQTVPDDSNSESTGDLGMVPDLGNGCQTVPGGSDGGRGARIMRYREKRRTRLFSKKIRYEVRRLNAERRPRMKGRFVKRTPGCS